MLNLGVAYRLYLAGWIFDIGGCLDNRCCVFLLVHNKGGCRDVKCNSGALPVKRATDRGRMRSRACVRGIAPAHHVHSRLLQSLCYCEGDRVAGRCAGLLRGQRRGASGSPPSGGRAVRMWCCLFPGVRTSGHVRFLELVSSRGLRLDPPTHHQRHA